VRLRQPDHVINQAVPPGTDTRLSQTSQAGTFQGTSPKIRQSMYNLFAMARRKYMKKSNFRTADMPKDELVCS
jgi:hypothetical protein